MASSKVPQDMEEALKSYFSQFNDSRILLQKLVQVEGKNAKLENRVLVVTTYRIYLYFHKLPLKEETSINYSELSGLESTHIDKLFLVVDDRRLKIFPLVDLSDLDEIINVITQAIQIIWPQKDLSQLLTVMVEPAVRLSVAPPTPPSPCGSFTLQYRCICDLLKVTAWPEIIWDIETIYETHKSNKLILNDFDHMDQRDLVPLIAALRHNMWFKTFCCCNVKLSPEALSEVCTMLRTNSHLELICVSNSTFKSDTIGRMATALAQNQNNHVRNIELDNNKIEDSVSDLRRKAGVLLLAPVLETFPFGLKVLSLSECQLTSKSINRLAEALSANEKTATSLERLVLSGNQIKDDNIGLMNLLAQPNCIKDLRMANCELAVEQVFGALVRGCSTFLQVLDLSRNVFTTRKVKDDLRVPVAWKQFFGSAAALKNIDLSATKLPDEAVKFVLLGLSANTSVSGVSVNLSASCPPGSAETLVLCLQKNINITEINISNNALNEDLVKVLNMLTLNQHVEKLDISKNFSSIKPKSLPEVLEAVVEMLQYDESKLTSLCLADSKLKYETQTILNSLGANETLKHLDISGNAMGDIGARMLSKLLTLNTTLTSLDIDRNNVTGAGLSDIARGLELNQAVVDLRIPINDVSEALKKNPDLTSRAVQKIGQCLVRNSAPGTRFSETQRLKQHLYIQPSIEAIDATLARCPEQSELTKEASKGRSLLNELEKCEGDGRAVSDLLNSMVHQLQVAAHRDLKDFVGRMMDLTQSQFPALLPNIKDELSGPCQDRAQLDKLHVKRIFEEIVTPDLQKTLSEVKLSVAVHLTEEVLKKILKELDKLKRTTVEGPSQFDMEGRTSIRRDKKSDGVEKGGMMDKKRITRPQSKWNIVDNDVEDYVIVDRDPKAPPRSKKKKTTEKDSNPSSNASSDYESLVEEHDITEIKPEDDTRKPPKTDPVTPEPPKEPPPQPVRPVDGEVKGQEQPDGQIGKPADGKSGETSKMTEERVYSKPKKKVTETPVKSVKEFDAVPSGERLAHLGKSRPRRPKTHASSGVLKTTDDDDDDSDNKVEEQAKEKSIREKRVESVKASKTVKSPISNVKGFFSRKKSTDPKSPEPEPATTSEPRKTTPVQPKNSPGPARSTPEQPKSAPEQPKSTPEQPKSTLEQPKSTPEQAKIATEMTSSSMTSPGSAKVDFGPPKDKPARPPEGPHRPGEAPSRPTEVPHRTSEWAPRPTEVPHRPSEGPQRPTEVPHKPTEVPHQSSDIEHKAAEGPKAGTGSQRASDGDHIENEKVAELRPKVPVGARGMPGMGGLMSELKRRTVNMDSEQSGDKVSAPPKFKAPPPPNQSAAPPSNQSATPPSNQNRPPPPTNPGAPLPTNQNRPPPPPSQNKAPPTNQFRLPIPPPKPTNRGSAMPGMSPVSPPARNSSDLDCDQSDSGNKRRSLVKDFVAQIDKHSSDPGSSDGTSKKTDEDEREIYL